MTKDDDLTALREDNARKAAAYRRMEDADVQHEKWALAAMLRCAALEAHVAALVDHGLVIVRHFNRCGGAGLQPAIDALDDLCRAPDLATLVAREQAREAVIAAAERWFHAEGAEPEANGLALAVSTYLRALDAAEKQP